MENYKKWIITAIVVVVAGIIVLAVLTSPDRPRRVTGQGAGGPMPAAPLVDTGVPAEPMQQLGVDMKDPESLSRFGDRYFENGMYKQAIPIYEKVLEIAPDHIDTYNDLGLALHYSGRSAEAVDMLRKGTEINPDFQRIWLSLGFVLMASGQKSQAAPVLEKARDLGPDTEIGIEAGRILGLLEQ